jgi:hypothetical protein
MLISKDRMGWEAMEVARKASEEIKFHQTRIAKLEAKLEQVRPGTPTEVDMSESPWAFCPKCTETFERGTPGLCPACGLAPLQPGTPADRIAELEAKLEQAQGKIDRVQALADGASNGLDVRGTAFPIIVEFARCILDELGEDK